MEGIRVRSTARESLQGFDTKIREQKFLDFFNSRSHFFLEDILFEDIVIHDLEGLLMHRFVLVIFSEREVQVMIETNGHSKEVRRMEGENEETIEELEFLLTKIWIQEEIHINLFIQEGDTFTCQTESVVK